MIDQVYEMLSSIRPEVDFRTKDDFFEDGFRDSMDFVQFITALNNQFDIEIDGLDIVPENFCNIDAIVALLKKYSVE